MQALWDEVAEQLASVPSSAGSATSTATARGKMLVRERIEAAGRPAHAVPRAQPARRVGHRGPGGRRRVAGIGIVCGTEVIITGSDMTYRGGSANPTTVAKNLRIDEISRANRLPVITLNESAGAELPRQADIFVPGGAGFKNLTQRSKLGIPSVTWCSVRPPPAAPTRRA
jgi:acyl-CoA carboxylase subunit beta